MRNAILNSREDPAAPPRNTRPLSQTLARCYSAHAAHRAPKGSPTRLSPLKLRKRFRKGRPGVSLQRQRRSTEQCFASS
eukprot:8874527-Alexandrium_andersonii.AAC.1